MPLRLLVGPTGSGKTRRVLDTFMRYSPSEHHHSVRFLVPTVPHVAHTRRALLSDPGFAGFLGEPVCTFYDMARGILASARIEGSERISEMQKRMMLAEVARASNGGYFSSMLDCPNFVDALGAEIGLLKVSAITPDHLESAVCAAHGMLNESSREKIQCLVSLYRAYQDDVLVERDLHDPEGVMWRALEVLRGDPSVIRDLKCVLLDGFGVLTPVQREFIGLLAAHCPEVTVTLDYDRDRADAFSAAAPDLAFLSALPTAHVEYLTAQRSFEDQYAGAALRHLQSRLFAADARTLPADSGVTIVVGVTPSGEAELIAGEIRRLIDDCGCAYSEIGIVSRDADRVGPSIGSAFGEYRIPVGGRDHPLAGTELAQTILQCLRVVLNGWRREHVLALLRSSFVVCDPVQCGLIDNAARQLGPNSGRDSWLGEWAPSDPTWGFRQQAFGPVAAFEDCVMQAVGSGIRDAIGSLMSALCLPSDERGLTESHAAWKSISRVMDDIGACEQVLGRGFGVSEYSDLLERGIGLARLRLASGTDDAVSLLSANAVGGRRFRHVFLVGLSENAWPRGPVEDPFLRDHERCALNEHLPHRLDVAADRDAQERYLFCTAVGSASERVYLCYSAGDASGSSVLPSLYIDAALSLFSTPVPRITREMRDVVPPIAESRTARALVESTVLACCSDSSGEAGSEALCAYNALLDAHSLSADDFDWLDPRGAEFADDAIIDHLGARAPVYRVTELEVYGSCPFRYFAQYQLGLSDVEDEPGALRRGSVLHAVLYRLYTALYAEGNPAEVTQVRALGLAVSFLDDCFARDPLLASLPEHLRRVEYGSLRDTLTRFIRAEFRGGITEPFMPTHFELEFGMGPAARDRDSASTSRRFVITLTDGGEAELSGKIDRVDVCPEGRALIVDYKTGGCPEISGIERGTALQPAIYAEALRKLFGLSPVGSEYRSLRKRERKGIYASEECHPSGRTARAVSPEVFEAKIDSARAFAARHIERIRAGCIAVEPVDCAKYCGFRSVCRVDR